MTHFKLSCLAFCIAVGFMFCVSSSAFADDCASAEIVKVGTNAGAGHGTASDNVIGIKCLSDTSWGAYVGLVPNAAIGDQALATALTAFSLDKTVWIRASAKTAGSMLNIIYLNK